MQHRRQRNGQSLVEFALLLPILLVILVVLADMGRAIAAQVALSNAAREGARYGANHPLDLAGMRNRALLEYNSSHVNVTGVELQAQDILISYPEGSAEPGFSVRVVIHARFPLFFGSFFPASVVDADGNMLLRGTAQMVIF